MRGDFRDGWSVSLALDGFCLTSELLTDGAGNRGKNVVGVATNKTNSSNYNHQHDRQHDGVLRDVLTSFIRPQLLQQSCHGAPPKFLAIYSYAGESSCQVDINRHVDFFNRC